MKVVKKGRPQKGWSVEVTCTGDIKSRGGCGAVLLVEQADIYTFMTGGSYCENADEQNYAFTCPECGVQTIIESDQQDFKRPKGMPEFPRHLHFLSRESWRVQQAQAKAEPKTSSESSIGFD